MSEAQQEKPADAWGQPISEERQAELAAMQAAWDAPGADHGDRKGPFHGVRLTGADTSWLAKRSGFGRDPDESPNLHLERAELSYARLEGAKLGAAHLEKANLSIAHLERAYLSNAYLEGADLNNAHLEGAYLFGAHLEGADLTVAHLEGADLLRAHLEGADLRSAHLEGADLAVAHLEGADVRSAWLDSKTNLTAATLDATTRLGNIHWSGVGAVDLTQLNWGAVPTLGDEQAVGARVKAGEHEAVVRAYRQVAAQLRAQGVNEVADRFLYRAQVYNRTVLLRSGRIPQWLGSLFLAGLAGYGYRPGRTILWYLAVVGGFALAYFLFGPSSAVHLTWNEALVVSLTAFHGRGFFATTFQPGDPLAALAAVEAVTGLLIEISFIATFTQRFFNAR
jgi:hypothetical protein